ncbi:Transcriptional regulatory protein LEU3 [Penicillium verhagenii]|uniref:Transcriptional regulatory protein LEU3 n=1 Tax=Penicillium verhagenii TaxID=1562060 RepID=UPI00254525A4|nr:Transcriptional regulatory protein LEU3 [Penicillium verhagenii]KAJ5948237.1 Transcriptional regulatory protein LEU3 [Penicillium verhagenii]
MAKIDHSIVEALGPKPSWLPDTIYHQLHIAHQGYRFCNVLGNNETTSTGLLPRPAPLIQMFDGELRAQDTRFASIWKTSDHIFFMATKLQLYSFTLTPAGLEAADDILSPDISREFFAHAYLTAMRLLQTALRSSAELPYWPEHQTRYILDAVLFLLKLIECSYEFVDEAAARNVISQIWQLLRGRSKAEEDHMSRFCAIIEYLSRNCLKKKIPWIKITSRVAGNLTIDSAWRARDRFSETVKAKRPADYTSAAALERSVEYDMQSSLQFLRDIGDWDSFFGSPALQGAIED